MAVSLSMDRLRLLVDDFRNLNPRDIGSWPTAPKVTALLFVFCAVIGAGWWFVWNDQVAALESAQNEEQNLKNQYVDKKRQAVNLDLYIQQLNEVETSFGALLKQLPNRTEVDTLLIEVNQAGLGRGLQFELFKPATEVKRDFFAELPVALKVTGNYHDLGAFASDIGRLSRIVTLNDITIAAGSGKSATLSMTTTAKTFRYLDEEEVAAARRSQTQGARGRGRK